MDDEKIEELKKELQTMTTVAKENKKLLFDAIHRIIKLENERADGGIMTIKNSTCYQDIVSILTVNGYFVTCHIDEENNGETITIEFWRA